MSRRSGQCGSVYVKGSQYIGRYRAEVPGQNKRVRRTVIIGNINQFTRPKVKYALRESNSGPGNAKQHRLFHLGHRGRALRDLFKRSKYPDVILSMCVIRRINAVLEPTKEKVLSVRDPH